MSEAADREVGAVGTKSRSVAWGVAIALGWCALIALTVHYDQQLKLWWDRLAGNQPVLEGAAFLLTKLISVHILLLLIILWSLFDRRVRWRLLTNTLWVMAAQGLLVEVLKHAFARLRPDYSLGVTIFCGPTLRDGEFGFPSGHATASFALAAIFSCYYPRGRWFFIAAATAVALARVQMGRHFFGDTIAGAVLGWYLARWVLQLLWRRNRRRDSRHAAQCQFAV